MGKGLFPRFEPQRESAPFSSFMPESGLIVSPLISGVKKGQKLKHNKIIELRPDFSSCIPHHKLINYSNNIYVHNFNVK